MNKTNHNKVIERFASQNGFVKTLKKASDFTDSPMPPGTQYYYYHFYYDINIKENTIQLSRIDENDTDAYEQSMKMCGDKYDEKTKQYYDDRSKKSKLISYGYEGSEKREWSISTDKKEFFSTFIHGRKKSEKFELNDILGKSISEIGNNTLLDIGNQSDNVAFLHAMRAAKEDKGTAFSIFEKHLKKCFAEYLFIKDPEKATFMLGIALHGIMDSFTPSHMDFQKFSEQDWGLHAQGDVVPFDIVIPFRKDDVEFDPGQSIKEAWYVGLIFDIKKDYNSDNHINDKEFEMFKIFAAISGLADDVDVQKIINETIDLFEIDYFNIQGDYQSAIETRPKRKLNEILKTKLYSKDAYVFSDAAVEVCGKVFKMLSETKAQINNNYQGYKDQKVVIDNAFNIWKNKYVFLMSKREALLDKIREVRGIKDHDKNAFAK